MIYWQRRQDTPLHIKYLNIEFCFINNKNVYIEKIIIAFPEWSKISYTLFEELYF